MQKVILAISGRKQSGKSSTCQFIHDHWFQDETVAVREFSFAGPLKQMCVDILGLNPEQVNGTDEQKNSIVPHLLWENFPVWRARIAWRKGWFGFPMPYLRRGPMTAREVMQFWGTEIFRRADPKVWTRASMKAVGKWFQALAQDSEYPTDRAIAIKPDGRFDNEVQAVKDAGGYVLRLTRNPHPGDTHPSEIALDAENYDWSNFDLVYDNSNQTVPEQMAGLTPWLREIGAIA